MRFVGLVLYPVLVFAIAAQARAQTTTSATPSQEHFNARSQPEGNPDCPPPVINGITPKNWSCRTGTQGVQGNPNCPPPVIIINGIPTTPRNWSCPGATQRGPIPAAIPYAGVHPGHPMSRAPPIPAGRMDPAATTGLIIQWERHCRLDACAPPPAGPPAQPRPIRDTNSRRRAATSSRMGRQAAISVPPPEADLAEMAPRRKPAPAAPRPIRDTNSGHRAATFSRMGRRAVISIPPPRVAPAMPYPTVRTPARCRAALFPTAAPRPIARIRAQCGVRFQAVAKAETWLPKRTIIDISW